jgi:hypothetical protein
VSPEPRLIPFQPFPLAHLRASRDDKQLQRANADEMEHVRKSLDVVCPECGSADLAWFWFSSPVWTWQNLCGRAGVVAFCDRDQRQVAFELRLMN